MLQCAEMRLLEHILDIVRILKDKADGPVQSAFVAFRLYLVAFCLPKLYPGNHIFIGQSMRTHVQHSFR
jgi:hypothetical protein